MADSLGSNECENASFGAVPLGVEFDYAHRSGKELIDAGPINICHL